MFRSLAFAASLLSLTLAPLTASAHGEERAAWKAAHEGAFRLTAFSLTRQVRDRLPGDPVVAAPLDGQRVYVHLTALNKGPARTLTLTWTRNGRRFHRVTLHVGRSPAWRTWAYITADKGKAGVWSVAVHDQDGTLLGEQFLILGPLARGHALGRQEVVGGERVSR